MLDWPYSRCQRSERSDLLQQTFHLTHRKSARSPLYLKLTPKISFTDARLASSPSHSLGLLCPPISPLPYTARLSDPAWRARPFIRQIAPQESIFMVRAGVSQCWECPGGIRGEDECV